MSKQSRALRAIYAEVPEVHCKGLCTEACGPIAMSRFEAKRLRMLRLTVGGDGTCPRLKDGRCASYSDRPLICRLFGAVDHELMRCPFGCRPGRYLTNDEASALLARAEAL